MACGVPAGDKISVALFPAAAWGWFWPPASPGPKPPRRPHRGFLGDVHVALRCGDSRVLNPSPQPSTSTFGFNLADGETDEDDAEAASLTLPAVSQKLDSLVTTKRASAVGRHGASPGTAAPEFVRAFCVAG